MKLNFERVGDVSQMTAEGEPEELAAFVKASGLASPGIVFSPVEIKTSELSAAQIEKMIKEVGPITAYLG